MGGAYLLCFALVLLGRPERLADLRDVFLGGRGVLSERLFELLCLACRDSGRGIGNVHVGCAVHAVGRYSERSSMQTKRSHIVLLIIMPG